MTQIPNWDEYVKAVKQSNTRDFVLSGDPYSKDFRMGPNTRQLPALRTPTGSVVPARNFTLGPQGPLETPTITRPKLVSTPSSYTKPIIDANRMVAVRTPTPIEVVPNINKSLQTVGNISNIEDATLVDKAAKTSKAYKAGKAFGKVRNIAGRTSAPLVAYTALKPIAEATAEQSVRSGQTLPTQIATQTRPTDSWEAPTSTGAISFSSPYTGAPIKKTTNTSINTPFPEEWTSPEARNQFIKAEQAPNIPALGMPTPTEGQIRDFQVDQAIVGNAPNNAKGRISMLDSGASAIIDPSGNIIHNQQWDKENKGTASFIPMNDQRAEQKERLAALGYVPEGANTFTNIGGLPAPEERKDFGSHLLKYTHGNTTWNLPKEVQYALAMSDFAAQEKREANRLQALSPVLAEQTRGKTELEKTKFTKEKDKDKEAAEIAESRARTKKLEKETENLPSRLEILKQQLQAKRLEEAAKMRTTAASLPEDAKNELLEAADAHEKGYERYVKSISPAVLGTFGQLKQKEKKEYGYRPSMDQFTPEEIAEWKKLRGIK